MMLMYQGIQIVYAVSMLSNPLLHDMQSTVFLAMMIMEYFNMIYVRSKNSIRFFPKVVSIGFLALHCYFFSSVAGLYEAGACCCCHSCFICTLLQSLWLMDYHFNSLLM